MSRDTLEQIERRYRQAMPGWRENTAPRCPLVVAGGRCRMDRICDPDCLCVDHDRVLDHARLWITPGGRYVLTAEPYEVDGATLARFITACEALGLRVWVSGRSVWYPGHTLLIRVEPANAGIAGA